jgi:hypothetical protein
MAAITASPAPRCRTLARCARLRPATASLCQCPPRFGPSVGRFGWLRPATRCRVCAAPGRLAAVPHVGAGQSLWQPLRGHCGSHQLSIPPTALAWRRLCCHVKPLTRAQWRWDTSLPHLSPMVGAGEPRSAWPLFSNASHRAFTSRHLGAHARTVTTYRSRRPYLLELALVFFPLSAPRTEPPFPPLRNHLAHASHC